MKNRFKIILLLQIIINIIIIKPLEAQDDYKYEIGGMVGTSFYMGDANQTELYKNSGPSAGFIFRYNNDLRWSLKNNFVMGRVAGNTQGNGNAYPFGEQASFERTFYEFGSQIEFNFYNYSDKFGYLGAKRFSPYIFTGIGVTLASGEKTFKGLNIPIGVGLKYKLKHRLNVGFEFSFRKLFSDSFDVTDGDSKNFNLEDPYEIRSGFSKNKDWYSLTMLSLTWDFGARICPCLNID